MVWSVGGVHEAPIVAVTNSEFYGIVVTGDKKGTINAWNAEVGTSLVSAADVCTRLVPLTC
jgi:hypothetical protein